MQRKWLTARLILSFILIFTITLLRAQTSKITGRVVDEANHVVTGATVKVTGTNIGITTDVEGRFILNLSSAATIQIEITAIGFTGKTISDVSSNGEELNITLTSSSNNLQAVTVQTSARRESTNSLIQFQKN